MSVDGEPHGTLTLVACVAGIIVAVILIAIIMFALDCGRIERFLPPSTANPTQNPDAGNPKHNIQIVEHPAGSDGPSSDQRRWKIFTIFGCNRDSYDVQNASAVNLRNRQNSVSTVMTDISWNAPGPSGLTESRETVFTIPMPPDTHH